MYDDVQVYDKEKINSENLDPIYFISPFHYRLHENKKSNMSKLQQEMSDVILNFQYLARK